MLKAPKTSRAAFMLHPADTAGFAVTIAAAFKAEAAFRFSDAEFSNFPAAIATRLADTKKTDPNSGSCI